MNKFQTSLVSIVAAACLAGCGSAPEQASNATQTQNVQQEGSSTKEQSGKAPASEPRRPEVVGLEKISGTYTLMPNGNAQRANVLYERWAVDGVEHSILSISYLRPNEDEKIREQLSSESAACAPAAYYSFESVPGEPTKLKSGLYQINPKDKGLYACGEYVLWTSDSETKSDAKVLNNQELAQQQQLFDYTVEAIHKINARSVDDARSPYIAK